MSELPPPPRGTCGFGDPALAFPEFAVKRCLLEKIPEGEGEGEDSSYGKGSFDTSSRFSSPSVSRNQFDGVENTIQSSPLKLPPSVLRDTSLKLSDFREKEDDNPSTKSGCFVDHIGQEDKRKWYGWFRKSCVCTCMFVSIALIILLLIGLSLNSSIKSRVPQVLVTNLNFTRLDFSNSSTEVFMNANLYMVLQLSNKNDKTMLSYSHVKADVFSENINLGHKKLQRFEQNSGNVTSLMIITRRRKAKVYNVDATLLESKEKKLEASVSLFLSAKLSFDWLGFMIHLPIVIACEDVKQSDVINGLKPKCNVQIFSK